MISPLVSLRTGLAPLRIGAFPFRDAVLYFLLTVVVTWGFWVPGGFLKANGYAIGDFFVALGSLVPLLVGLFLNLAAGQRTFEWGDWFRNLNVRNVSVALILPGLFLIPIILYRLYIGNFSLLQFFEDLRAIPLAGPGLFLLAFCEEVGWRGYLLKRLDSYKLFLVNFVVGFAWFFWQIPIVLAAPHDVFSGDAMQHLAAFLLYSILITPFLNRLALHSGYDVFLPALLRATLTIAFTLYSQQAPVDLVTAPFGVAVLAWLAALNLLLFGQLWQGRRSGEESELERVMPLEPEIR